MDRVRNDLNILQPEPTVVDIASTHIEITPLRVGELPAMVKAIRPFAAQLAGEPDWLGLLAEHSEALLDALAITSRRPREWVDGLELDDALQLAAAVFEVNADFFVARVSPKVAALAQGIEARVAGSTASSDSSVPDTATPTS